MSFVFPEIVLQRIITLGIKKLRANKTAFYDIFSQYYEDEMIAEYGEAYVDQIWNWFSTTKIPVVQAWALNVQKIPCISIHLANETEDESKAAFNDVAADDEEDGSELGTGVFTVMVDIGIHANKAGDHVLWLYYIVSYILFKNKLQAHRLGLKLQTFSASDYNKDNNKMAENIWTRWIRFRCTTENFWGGDEFIDIQEVNTDMTVGNEPASQISVSLDVDPEGIDITANEGIIASQVGDEDGEDDLLI